MIVAFPKSPVRAIRVEPFNRHCTHWQAFFDGDEWTSERIFAPCLPLREMLPLIQRCPERLGLPIVVINPYANEVTA